MSHMWPIYTMTCDSQEMEKSVFYSFQASMGPDHRSGSRRGGSLGWSGCEIRSGKVESGARDSRRVSDCANSCLQKALGVLIERSRPRWTKLGHIQQYSTNRICLGRCCVQNRAGEGVQSILRLSRTSIRSPGGNGAFNAAPRSMPKWTRRSENFSRT